MGAARVSRCNAPHARLDQSDVPQPVAARPRRFPPIHRLRTALRTLPCLCLSTLAYPTTPEQTPLEPASEDDVLDKLGVCGGDLLWLLSPAPEVSPPAHGSSATNGSSTMNGGSSSNAAPAATTAAAAVAAGGAGSGAAAAAPVAALAPAAAVDSGGTGGGAAAVAGIEGGGGGAAAAGGEDGAEEGPLAPLPVEEGEAEAEAGSGAAAAVSGPAAVALRCWQGALRCSSRRLALEGNRHTA